MTNETRMVETAGEWTAMRYSTDTSFEILGRVGGRSHSIQLAVVNHPRSVREHIGDPARIEDGPLTETEALSIARQMAAAPALYEALWAAETALAVMDSYRETDKSRISGAIAQVRAAIAAARGEE